MKPKLNELKKKIECGNPIFTDFPNILIGNMTEEKALFDASAYCEASDVELPPYSAFYTQCYKYIDAICRNNDTKSSELFYVNADKHLLIDFPLTLVFIQYVTPDVCVYINNILMSCFGNGMAFSNAFAAQLAAFQLPNETLQEIIQMRNEQEKEQQK